MKKIIRLTESDLSRIVRRIIKEAVEKPKLTIPESSDVDVSGLIGYTSPFLSTVNALVTDSMTEMLIDIKPLLGKKLNMSDVGYGYGEYNVKILNSQIPKTREEVSKIIQNVVTQDKPGTSYTLSARAGDCLYNSCKPYAIAAGGTTTNSKGQKVTWGNPGKYLGTELTDVVCKVLGIS